MTVKTVLIRCAVEVGIALVTEVVIDGFRRVRSGEKKPERKLGFKKSKYYELEEEGL